MNATQITMNTTKSNIKTWGIYDTVEDVMQRHSPSGEHNGLVASIIWADRDNRRYCSGSTDTIYDIPVCTLRNSLAVAETEEKRLVKQLEKIHEEIKEYILSSDSEGAGADDDDDEEEDDEIAQTPDIKNINTSHRDKRGKDPKWVQQMSNKKKKLADAKKRKSLMTSMGSAQTTLTDIRRKIMETKTQLVKQEMLQSLNQQLSKSLKGAEVRYKQDKNQEHLMKRVHYNMSIWDAKTKDLLPPVKMVERLSGVPGNFKTVLVPEYPQTITPLNEYLRSDW